MDTEECVVISDSDDIESTTTLTGNGNGATAPDGTNSGRKKRERLPRVYTAAYEALSARLDNKDQLKRYIFRLEKCRNLGRMKRLVSQAYDNYKNLVDTLKSSGFSFEHCDERLAAVIAADVAFSSEMFLPVSKHPKVLAIMELKTPLRELQAIKVEGVQEKERFRYAHVNKLISSREYLDKDLKRDGYVLSQFQAPESATSEEVLEAYYNHLRSLEIFEYTWDLHFPDDVLVFNPRCDIHSKVPFRRKHLFMYDKSVAAPARALAPTTHDKVLDACSAPGNKATLIAQTCKALVCCERKEKRYRVLCENLCTSFANKRCDIKALHVDFLQLEFNDPRVADCTMAIVDPSCSGGVDFEREVDPTRVEKLANLQACCLKKALSFPEIKTVVYSTCSSEHRENEGVIKEIVEWADAQPKDPYKGNWKLQKVLPDLPFRANEKLYPGIGDKCLFLDEARSKTSVQFVAKFERVLKKKTAIAKLKSDPAVRLKLKRLRHRKNKRQKEKQMKAQKVKNAAEAKSS